jgi:hypothetical protein
MSNLLQMRKQFEWSAQERRMRLVQWRRGILPSWFYFDVTGVQGPLPVPAWPVPAAPAHFIVPYHGGERDDGLGTPFEARYIMYTAGSVPGATAAANMWVRLTDPGSARYLMNRWIHIRNLAGTAQLPFRLREPLFIPSRRSVLVEVQGLDLEQTTLRMYLFGARYFPWAPEVPNDGAEVKALVRRWLNRRQYVVPYWLTTDDDDVHLAGNGTTTAWCKNGDEAHLELFGITAVSLAGTGFGLDVTEAETGNTLANGQFTDANAVGTGTLPYLFPVPYLLPAGYRLKVIVTDLGGRENIVKLAFFGRRIYAPLRQVQQVLKDTVVSTPADVLDESVPPAAWLQAAGTR